MRIVTRFLEKVEKEVGRRLEYGFDRERNA